LREVVGDVRRDRPSWSRIPRARRRGILVGLNSRGQEVLVTAVGEQAAKEAKLVDVLDGEDRERTNELLRKLLIHFEELMGPPPRHREQE
jgi:DNA-binding MarR family transcriptional regulator